VAGWGFSRCRHCVPRFRIGGRRGMGATGSLGGGLWGAAWLRGRGWKRGGGLGACRASGRLTLHGNASWRFRSGWWAGCRVVRRLGAAGAAQAGRARGEVALRRSGAAGWWAVARGGQRGGAVDWLPGDGRFHVVRHCVGTPALCLKGVVGAGRGSCRRGCGSDRWASPPGRARAQVWRGRGSRWRGDGGWRRGGGRTYSAGSGRGSAAVRRRRTSRL